jgi:hypothetical protein
MRWPERTDKERFFDKVEQPANGSACWVWTAAKCSSGYGNFYFGGRVVQAHRVALALFRGIDAGESLVCHHCDNPKCVNPDHLFLGTHQDNADDKMRKGRHTWANKTHCTRGHELTGDNLYIAKTSGARVCRECMRAHGRVYDRKRRPTKRARAA